MPWTVPLGPLPQMPSPRRSGGIPVLCISEGAWKHTQPLHPGQREAWVLDQVSYCPAEYWALLPTPPAPGIKPRTLCMLGEHAAVRGATSPAPIMLFILRRRPDPETSAPGPQPCTHSWDSRPVLTGPASAVFSSKYPLCPLEAPSSLCLLPPQSLFSPPCSCLSAAAAS